MRSLPSIVPLALLLAGCGSDMDGGVDGAIANCECEAETAAETSYDNVSSGLPGDNVQDALDDVAARTDPAGDAFERISLVTDSATSSAGSPVTHEAFCPKGHKAIGGSCDTSLLNTSIQRTVLLERQYQCYWNNPDGEIGANLTATVTCLAPPQ